MICASQVNIFEPHSEFCVKLINFTFGTRLHFVSEPESTYKEHVALVHFPTRLDEVC